MIVLVNTCEAWLCLILTTKILTPGMLNYSIKQKHAVTAQLGEINHFKNTDESISLFLMCGNSLSVLGRF